MKFRKISIALGLGALALCATAAEKKIYAHYMGCYPAGRGALNHHLRNMSKEMKHASGDYNAAIGGRIVNWPLLPQNADLSAEESAELEVRRAIRGGIDGFAIDAWAGQDGAKDSLSALIRAAEKLDAPFEVTLCLDPSCHPRPAGAQDHIQTFTDSIKWLLDNHGKSPKLARRNGKVLIVGYSSRGIIYDPEFRALPETPEKWARIAAAYREVEKRVGVPLFFHFCFDNMAVKDPAIRKQAAAWAGKNFDAVGGFLGNGWDDDMDAIRAIKEGGAEWSQPLFYQYNNKQGSLFVEKGTDKLRRAWELARKTDSTLIQFVTWNDYGEETILAPAYGTNYTILSLNKYFVDFWKQGKAPKVDKEIIHLIFRRALDNAPTFPFGTRRTAPGVLEVTTLLNAPGKIVVPHYGEYEAEAGLFVKQFPLKVGKVGARLVRDGKTLIDVTAHEEVTDKPFREDNTMVCFSSDFLEEWRADFGKRPPLYYSENGDVDGDGLPNWFEMYYFGRFPFMNTATSANPGDDPDGDGKTNLEEYNARTSPVVADKPYSVGYCWNFDEQQSRGLSFNPDRDSHWRDVWFYRYKHGEKGKIPHDGNYDKIPSSWMNVPYAGKMAHLTPPTDPAGYRYLHGWIARKTLADGSWGMIVRPRANAALILEWRSPVAGRVEASFAVAEANAALPLRLDLQRGKESLLKAELKQGLEFKSESIAVKPGDSLYFVFDDNPPGDSGTALLKNFQIRLEKTDE